MKVGAKLNLAFYSILAVLILTVAITFYNLDKIDKNLDEALDVRVEQLRVVNEIRVDLAMQGLYARALMLDTTDKNRESLIKYAEDLDGRIEELKGLIKTGAMEQYATEITGHNEEFNVVMAQVLEALDANDMQKATVLVKGDLVKANEGILKTAEKMIDFQNEQLENIRAQANDSTAQAKLIAIISIVISVIISIVLIVYVRRAITAPLGRVMEAAESIAEGDLTHADIEVRSKDEIGQLGTVFNTMKKNLRELLSAVQGNSEQLSAAAQELSASTEEITATSEDVTRQIANTSESSQAAAVAAKESAVAMEETAQGVQRIAESSQTLNNSSIEASQTATHGGTIIEHAKTQMNVINESTATVNDLVQKLAKQTEEIGNITKVITDITEQTNLLALNAAIEAARAGEHGKGFAVVADEVRKLAEESKASANSIVQLTLEIQADTTNVERAVSNSLVSVRDGVEIISEAGQSFNEIVRAVDVMTEQIQEISAVAEELSASAEQVSASVTEIANGAEAASGSIETIAAAMEEQSATMQQVSNVAVNLADNASELQAEISKFKV